MNVSLTLAVFLYFCSMPELDSLNFNDVFHHFLNTIKTVTNTHAPLKQCTRRQKKLQRKSWISKGLYVSIQKKQKLYKTHYLSRSNNQKTFYKRYANLLTKLKTAAKKLYFENQLKSVTNNPNETWNILRELLPKKKCDTTPSTLKFNDAVISDKNEIAGIFYTFFATVGHKISEDINSTKSHIDYLKNSVTSSMVLFPLTPTELATELKRLNANKSTSDNKIPTKFLIIAADVLSPYLAYLVEYIFTQGIFPDELKIAQVVPTVYIKPALTNQLKITNRFHYFRHFQKSLKN